jgi:hypothetical protein
MAFCYEINSCSRIFHAGQQHFFFKKTAAHSFMSKQPLVGVEYARSAINLVALKEKNLRSVGALQVF